jgi:hydroxyisourate hydrolase
MIAPSSEQLATALGVQRWVADVAAGASYDDLDALLERAAAAATPLTPSEIDEALAHHPRIGERPAGEGAAQAFSRREQASADAEDAEVNAAIAAGNAAYEERFGRVFLIRAAGRTRAEILAELRRRLELDDATELQNVGDQLREIALLRLRAMFAGGRVTTHVLDAARGRPAAGIAVTLSGPAGSVASGRTDADGRVSDFGPEALQPGDYRLEFATGEWFAEQGVEAFYPRVVVDFRLGEGHHHVPVLLSPFAYSTYRGS